jgi:hypothetical protein
MRVLVAAFVESIHAVRAVEPMTRLGWDVHVVASHPHWANPAWRDVTLHVDSDFEPEGLDPSVRVQRLEPSAGDAEPVIEGLSWGQRVSAFADLVKGLKPDLLDSMEIQHGGYLVLEARALLSGEPPPWMVHNWGSDVYYYGRNPRHLDRLKGVLGACDYYGCECDRDVELARTFGFSGKVLPVLPNAGGFDLEQARSLRSPGPASARDVIALKATSSFVYRPDVALDAIESCGDVLRGHRLALYTASDDIQDRAGRICSEMDIGLETVSGPEALATHERILSMHGEARVSISLSESDAICTSFLEAMVMGSLPIQSDTGCSSAWAEDGRGALFVDPLDAEGVARALRRALSDDSLVDSAAKINAAAATARLDHGVVLARMTEAYEEIAAEVLSGAAGPGPAATRIEGERVEDWYDSELLERDAHIAALRRHVSEMQRSLDGFHQRLEPPDSSRDRGARRRLSDRVHSWVQRRASKRPPSAADSSEGEK